MSDLPETIANYKIRAALDLLGMPSSGTRKVVITPGSVEVTTFQRRPDGSLIVGDDGGLSTVVTTIPMVV